jgi:hypothetical protein
MLTGAIMGARFCRSVRCVASPRTLAAVWPACPAEAGDWWRRPRQDPESEFGAASNEDLIGRNLAMRFQKQEVRPCLTPLKLTTPWVDWSVAETESDAT